MRRSFLCVLLCLLACRAAAAQEAGAPSQIVQPLPGVAVVLDDGNNFGGLDKGTTHQSEPEYWIEKTLIVPARVLATAKQARVRVYLHVFDYSYTTNKDAPNGLDESFEMLVNGQSHVYRTDSGVPARLGPGQPARHQWYDFTIPVAQLKAGANTILFRKLPAPAGKKDDFLYIGIDNSASHGRSRSSLDGGKTWRTDKLNVPGGGGEYMIRLVLFQRDVTSAARWTPRAKTDPDALIGYAETRSDGVTLELDADKIDAQSPTVAAVRYQGTDAPQLKWSDDQGVAIEVPAANVKVGDGLLRVTLPPRVRPAKLEVAAAPATLNEIALEYSLAVNENVASPIDMAPRIAAPKGRPVQRAPRAALTAGGFVLENSVLRAQFTTRPALQMQSLWSEYLQKNVLAQPEATRLFLTEIGERRFGAQDWKVENVKVVGGNAVAVEMTLPGHDLKARFTVGVDASTLRFGLNVTNAGNAAQSWKTAFPHLGGLVLSADESGDNYLFPYRGGIIGATPANLRTVYGEQTAWWQMVDMFSPSGGAGLSLRADDTSGLYKGVALRKGEQIATGAALTSAGRSMLPEMFWQNSLAPAPGTAFTFEYLRRTRAPKDGFAPPDAVLEMHAGDWRAAMRTYSDWAHRVWKWRPLNAKLRDVWNVTSPGWGQGVLFKDGKYRTDYVTPLYDAAELQSWWSPSEKGPWGVPVERVREELGDKFYNQYLKGYIVKNPATGALQYRFNPGDYTGYNPEWGGLPALRSHIEKMKDAGQVAMLYTCPALVDFNTETGRRFGAKYGAINTRWKDGLTDDIPSPPAPKDYIGAYAGWNLNPDNAETPDYVAAQMKRIIQETGADGMRLDVYGYQGYADDSPNFKRLFAEPGHNAYLQATTNAVAKIRAAVDEVDPSTIVTLEFPGYDHLMAHADGSIVYETGQSVLPGVRPVPCNLLRFYFPEFKTYDLDNLDANSRASQAPEWRFWNAMGAFGIVHPPLYHNALEENGDAFNATKPEALVSTLVPRVYANRFTSGAKSVVTLYNARKFTVDEPLLRVLASDDTHHFDLLNGRELVPDADGALRLKLAPGAVACVATLPRRLSSASTREGWKVSVRDATKQARVALVAADSTILAESPVVAGAATLLKPEAKKAPAYLKLFDGKYLLDAVALPVAAPTATVAPTASAAAKIVYGSTADFNRAATGLGVGGGNGGLVAGNTTVAPAGGRNAIVVFDLSAYRGVAFQSAELALFLTQRAAGATFNLDLYGAGYAKNAAAEGLGAPEASDYYEGEFGGDKTNATGLSAIQEKFFTPASPLNGYGTTEGDGDARLLAFLNARGDNDFVFFRLSPDTAVNAPAAVNPQLYVIAAAENKDTFADPKLTLTLPAK